MRLPDRTWSVFLAACLCCAATGIPSGESHPASAVAEQPAPADSRRETLVPQKARDLLEALQRRGGEPLPGYIGGRTFHNRERRLPPGRYREYDVNPKRPGRPRGGERLVIDHTTGKAYYTDDHYRSFTPLN